MVGSAVATTVLSRAAISMTSMSPVKTRTSFLPCSPYASASSAIVTYLLASGKEPLTLGLTRHPSQL
jgi:hypothetical protein